MSGSTKTLQSTRGWRARRLGLSVLLVWLAAPAMAQDVFIEKSTNGQDADLPPGPTVVVGDPVSWTYLVTAGTRDLQNVVVSDDQGVSVSCPQSTLAAGLSMTCTAAGLAAAGQYANIGTVNAEYVVNGQPVTPATDSSHYFGVAELALAIEKATEGFDADTPPGPALPVGGSVNWTYVVTNTGTTETLSNVVVSDDQGVTVNCPDSVLDPGESMICTGSGIVQLGPYANIGQATAELPGPVQVVATDASHYVGQALIVQKATNGQDADVPPGPSIPVGDPVAWTYLVGNPGPETVSSIVVTDDQGVVVTCPDTSLTAGSSMVCTGNGVAAAGPYANLGSATGQLESGAAIAGSDPSHYSGVLPNAVDIEKATNGQDADLPPGPVIATGMPVNWTYLVSNFGNAALTGISVTDDQGVTVTCPGTSLDPGESMTCTANGTALVGPYENLGTVNATLAGTGAVTDSDLSHYFGQDQEIDYGDAPDPSFPTLFASVGAGHVLSPTVFLGACVDSEIDGQPSLGADGDDLGAGTVTHGTCAVPGEDEDGVTFLDPLISGSLVDIEVVANATCTLTAWIDFNVDGDWDEPSDALFPGGTVLAPGLNTLSFTVPSDAFGGTTYARFRCTTDTAPEGGVYGPRGLADDGEVEDYAVVIELDLGATLVDSPGTAAMPGDAINYEATITSVAGSASGVDFDLTLDPNTLPTGVVTTTPLARDDGLYEVDPALPTTVNGTTQPKLLANDFGIPAPTAIAAVAQPTTLGGAVDVSTDGSFTYIPFGGAVGGEIDSFTYDIENGIPATGPVVDTATATLILGGPPVAADDDADGAPAYFVSAGAALSVVDGVGDPVERNDFIGSPAGALSQFGGGDLGGAVTDNAAGATVTPLPGFGDGSLTVNADGSFTFATPTGLSGPWQFEYRLTNPSGTSDATVTIEVQIPPDAIDDGPAPNASPGDPFATLPGVPIDTTTHATPTVLLNDVLGVPAAAVSFYGTSGAPMTAPVESGPTPTDQGGTVEVSTNGNFIYTPPGGFAGNDAFGYVLANGAGSDSAVVTILVAGPPIAEDDALTTVQNAVAVLDAAVDNGSGADDFGNPVGAVDVYGPVGGPLTTAPGGTFVLASGNTVNFTGGAGVGTFTYDATVNPTFSGNDAFDYQLINVAGSDTATVTITVEAPPTAVDDFPDMLSAPGDAYHTALDTVLDSSSHATPPVITNDDLGFPIGVLVSYGTSGSPTDQTVPGAPTATDNGGTVVVAADGNFVYTPPSPTFTGPDQFGYRLQNSAGFDDGVVTVAVGLRPVCDDESDPDDYDAIGNVSITVPLASGVLIGDTGDGITVTGNTAPASGGSAVVAADGSFTYVSGAGFNGDDMFTYTVGNGFGNSAACSVEVVVTDTIWFIDNQASGGGNGTLAAPYDSLNGYSTAALDAAGDIVFIDEGDGTSVDYDTGVVLKDNQLLIGQGVDLTTTAGLTLPPFSAALPGVAGRPVITNTGGAGINLASGNLATGLDVNGALGAGIAGTNSAAATIDDVGLGANGSDGVVFSNATGSINIDNLDVTNGGTIGINISGGSATFDFDSSSSITSPTGIAFRLNGGTASVTYNGTITQANNATTVSVANHSGGTVTFQTGTVGATNGDGLQFSNADGIYNFSGTTTLNGGDAGIDIVGGSAGTFTFANTTITTPTNGAFNVDASSPGITFSGGSITQNSAATAYRANGNGGGTQNIAVPIIANTSTAAGISLTNNTGASINFTGALDIDTTSGAGFVATGGGTVTTNPGVTNTVNTTTGRGVNIANTTIGGSGVTFRSVSSTGAPNGILLNSTGTSGGLTVTGDGGGAQNGSGGSIASSTGDGISLTSTRNVSLTQLDLSNSADHGIDINSVTNFTYQDATMSSDGNADDEHSVRISNLFGTSLIEDVVFDNINEDAVEYYNSSADDGTRDILTIRRGDFNSHEPSFGEMGVDVQSSATALMGLVVDDCDFDINANGALGVIGSSIGSSNLSITVQDSTFNAANAFGAGTIQIVNASTSIGTNVITGNTINDTPFNGILVNNDDDATSTATISNNMIDGSGVGVNNGYGIQTRQDENGSFTVLIDSNQIGDMDANQIRVQGRDTTDNTGVINATITNNTALNAPGDFIFGLEVLIQDDNDGCADIRGNNFIGNDGGFPGFGDDIRLSEGATSTLNVEQTSAANITALNNGDSVSVGGTPNFSAGNCPTP